MAPLYAVTTALELYSTFAVRPNPELAPTPAGGWAVITSCQSFILPIAPVPPSANQRLPSGAVTIPTGLGFLTTPAGGVIGRVRVIVRVTGSITLIVPATVVLPTMVNQTLPSGPLV